jgi:serine protease
MVIRTSSTLNPLVPTDPQYAQQWSLSDATAGVRAPAAWDKATGKGVVVAIIDTGVRPHADLAAQLLPGYDFVNDTKMSADGNGRDADASDPGDFTTAGQCASGSSAQRSSWHGTHVAGIVAAAANNGQGVAGVAFGAKLLPVRALGRCGGYSSDIADAITWSSGGSVSGVSANANPAKVINLSLGGPGNCSITTQNAINAARSRGAVVVVAAGNEKSEVAGSQPANCSGVIAVAATNKAGGRASYSNFGSKVTLAAPGGDTTGGILSTHNAGTSNPAADSYAQLMGTSMATPVVSGVVALVLQANPKLTPDQVASTLTASSRAFPAACSGCGAGLVNAEAAVLRAVGTVVTAPAPAPKAGTVTEVESNDTLDKAQRLARVPVTVTGSVASTSDVDHYRVSVPAGKTLVAKLSTGTSSGFGLAALTASGQTLVQLSAVPGQQTQISITNPGSGATDLVLRVQRSSGAIGSYTLALSL